MDSFFSLFDPSESQNKPAKKRHKPQLEQDNAKKKLEPPKGRRRGRKCQGKQDPLPEESSFLCEPQLSGEILVHGGYLDSYIVQNEDPKADSDNKPKRRNSGRKNRRKKNKISPGKELQATAGWSQSDGSLDVPNDVDRHLNLNNKCSRMKNSDDSIGKNVNDLTDYKKGRRKSEDGHKDLNSMSFNERAVYNVIDKLEKVSLKNDTYLSGEFNTEDLANDCFYNSDDMDESFDDTTSEAEDSSDEAYGCLPPEPRFGNVEYKLQLVAPCERRFQHLVTQLKWRLRSGGGSAVYVLGVRDCGALRGLRARALRASLHTLRRMAEALDATMVHLTARRVATHRAVAEVYIRKLADTQQSVELRVAVLGANEAGKSTLIGVLTQGELDNGRGSARLNMFRHLHEVKSGRTSSLSHEILGFDAQGNVVNYGCSELMTAERIGERSAKLVVFLDLAGHTKYQRTTLHGLSGYSPHYAMIVISATAGITNITEEHIALLLALDLPFFAVITKCDIAAANVPSVVCHLQDLLSPSNKRAVLIRDENAARDCVAPQRLILDSLQERSDDTQSSTSISSSPSHSGDVHVFPVSCVRGTNLSSLHAYLVGLQPAEGGAGVPAGGSGEGGAVTSSDAREFQVDEVFHVHADTHTHVVAGLLARGVLHEGDEAVIGPLENGSFVPVKVTSVYRNRAPHQSVSSGQAASLGLVSPYEGLVPRPGMVLLDAGRSPAVGADDLDSSRPVFGGCSGNCAKSWQLPNIIQNATAQKDRKNHRRKNKNLLQDIVEAKNCLIKDKSIKETNLFTDESEKDGGIVEGRELDRDGDSFVVIDGDLKESNGVCTCGDRVYLEDPNDPRGCIYFQASVHVLRHPTTIYPGFQCTVHVGNVRQTAIIEGIMSHRSELRAGECASVVFRFARCPEYLVRDRRLLLTAGLATRAIGRITQTFPYIP